jgi:hypothetical protein
MPTDQPKNRDLNRQAALNKPKETGKQHGERMVKAQLYKRQNYIDVAPPPGMPDEIVKRFVDILNERNANQQKREQIEQSYRLASGLASEGTTKPSNPETSNPVEDFKNWRENPSHYEKKKTTQVMMMDDDSSNSERTQYESRMHVERVNLSYERNTIVMTGYETFVQNMKLIGKLEATANLYEEYEISLQSKQFQGEILTKEEQESLGTVDRVKREENERVPILRETARPMANIINEYNAKIDNYNNNRTYGEAKLLKLPDEHIWWNEGQLPIGNINDDLGPARDYKRRDYERFPQYETTERDEHNEEISWFKFEGEESDSEEENS